MASQLRGQSERWIWPGSWASAGGRREPGFATAPGGEITREYLRAEDLALVRRQGSRLLAIRRPGYDAFTDLTEAMIALIPGIRRGAQFANFRTALLEFLDATYLERPAESVGQSEVSSLRDRLLAWFQERAKPRRIFVPCVISPRGAPTFAIGPVEFVFIEDVRRSPFYARIDSADVLTRDAFNRMLETMRVGHANWLARLAVEGPFAIEEKVAIIELRGGTHLLLLEVDQLTGEGMAQSLTGQFHQRFAEQFDLMIKGKGLDELKRYRLELVSRGIAVGEIPDETFFGHHLFCIKDPDGNGITIYTSHAIH